MTKPSPADADALVVLYDGAWPLCQAEIDIYRELTPDRAIEFCDVSNRSVALPADCTREQLLARFHVQH